MFNGWLNGINKKLLYKILVGASTWAIWLNRNDIVFNNSRAATHMQVIFRGTHWIRFWTFLQKEDERPVCFKPCLWRSLPPMVGPLVIIELLLDDFEVVSETDSFVFTYVVPSCVITNNYMHSFMQMREY
jgi:hypothetical protein